MTANYPFNVQSILLGDFLSFFRQCKSKRKIISLIMENESDVFWKGTHLSEFQTNFNLPQFPGLVDSDDHVVLVHTPVIVGRVPDCYPSIFDKVDYWDQDHVKLPCSEKNVTEDQINRWGLIREALSSVVMSAHQLEAAILSYNKRFAERWNFATLKDFFDEVFDEEETAIFFQSLFPKMVDLALSLPELITGGIPLLKHGSKRSVSLSQMQIASLLANAFFCTFPRRNSYAKGCEYANYPTINFTRLFQAVFRDRKEATYEKLRCILHYFRRITSSPPTGVITYSRHFVPNLLIPQWPESGKKLTKLFVSSKGTIEDDGFGLYQVDFAHKLVGGGVIANGCVQEEIRFIISPELILSRLFTECLDNNEALIVTGCERFSKYKGYGRSFQWDGNYVDETPCDEEGRKYCTIIAIDALFFKKNPNEQYLPQKINRELNKAYAGFSWGSRVKKEQLCGIATGNWGCGVYKGNVELKSLLQMMAAAECNRDLAYFTFADDELRDSMDSLHRFLVDNNITVGKIFNLLCQFNALELYNSTTTLYEYVRREALNENLVLEKAKENSNNVATNVIKPRLHQMKLDFKKFSSRPKKMADQKKKSQEDKPDTWRNNADSDREEVPQPRLIDDPLTQAMKKRESEMFLKMYAPSSSNSAVNDDDDSFDFDTYRKVKRICTENRTNNDNGDRIGFKSIQNQEDIPHPLLTGNVEMETEHDENYENTSQTESLEIVPDTPPPDCVEEKNVTSSRRNIEKDNYEQRPDESKPQCSNLVEFLDNKTVTANNCNIENDIVERSPTDYSQPQNDIIPENTRKSDIQENSRIPLQKSSKESDSTKILNKIPVVTQGRSKPTPLDVRKYSTNKLKRETSSKKKLQSQKRKISDYFSPS